MFIYKFTYLPVCLLTCVWMVLQIGRADLVLLFDCEEATLRRRLFSRGVEQSRPDDNTLAIEKRIIIFKNETMPAIKHFDDAGRVEVVSMMVWSDLVWCGMIRSGGGMVWSYLVWCGLVGL